MHRLTRSRLPATGAPVRRRRAARRARPSPWPSGCASSTTPGGIPERYVDMLAGLGRLRRRRQGARLRACSACTRSGGATSGSPTCGRCCARCAVASALLVARLRCSPSRSTTASRARSSIIDFLLTCRPARRRPARAPDRSPSARSGVARAAARAQRAGRRRRLGRPDGGPRAAAQPATSARARSASSTTTRASAACALLGLKVLGTTDEIGAILDETEPDEVVIAIPSAPGVAARQGRRRLPRARDPGAHAADRVRAAARRRPAHPPAARGPGRGRARPRAGA